jgi:hypothetical protein
MSLMSTISMDLDAIIITIIIITPPIQVWNYLNWALMSLFSSILMSLWSMLIWSMNKNIRN